MSKYIKKLSSTGTSIAVLVAVLFAVNIIFTKFNAKLDVTEDKVFTLSEGTETLLSKLENDIEVRLYFSRSLKDLPIFIKSYGTRVEELLAEYADLSDGKIQVKTVDPKPDTDEEEWARKFGVSNMKLQSGEELYFGIVFMRGKNEQVIPYIDPRREEFLEYDLTEALVRVLDNEKAKVGLFSSLPVWGNPGSQEPAWAFLGELQKSFDLVDLKDDFVKILDLNVAILFHPKNLDELQTYYLDQFVLNGGRLIVAVDPFSRVDLSEAAKTMGQQQMFSYQPNSDLGPLFKSWGVEFNANEIVGDAVYATPIATAENRFNYQYFITLRPESFSKDHILSAKLPSLMINEGGSFAAAKEAKLKFESLVSSSAETAAQDPKMLVFTGPYQFSQSFKPENKTRTLAAMLSGKFPSSFKSAPAESKSSKEHLTEALKEASVLLVGDTDFLHDANAADKFRFGNQIVVRPKNGNLSFLLNAVEYLGGRDELIALRSRGKAARPFVKMLEIQKDAQQKWHQVEEDLSKKISDIQGKINELQKERSDGNKLLTLTAEQQREIENFRNQEVAARKKRREVRKNLREDIEKLQRKIILANMIVVPGFIVGIGFTMLLRRSRRQSRNHTVGS